MLSGSNFEAVRFSAALCDLTGFFAAGSSLESDSSLLLSSCELPLVPPSLSPSGPPSRFSLPEDSLEVRGDGLFSSRQASLFVLYSSIMSVMLLCFNKEEEEAASSASCYLT